MARQRLDEGTRTYIFHRDNFKCQIRSGDCTGDASEIDHIVPVVSGGGDETDNLRASCRACNRRRWHHDRYIWSGQPAPGSDWAVT